MHKLDTVNNTQLEYPDQGGVFGIRHVHPVQKETKFLEFSSTKQEVMYANSRHHKSSHLLSYISLYVVPDICYTKTPACLLKLKKNVNLC
jgi:hypothetical protein